MTTLQLGYREGRSITRSEAKNFYYAVLTLPQARRSAIYVVYAFCRQCDDAVDEDGSRDDKLAALADLRLNLGQAYSQRASNPLFEALADVAFRYNIPQEYFEDVIRGVEADLTKTSYKDFEELRGYCYQVASAVGLICLQIFGYRDMKARDHAVDLGLAMQLTNIIRDVREDLEMGRVYLPQDEMSRFGYSEAELRNHTINGPFVALMRFQAERARRYFDSGFQLLPYLSPRSRSCPAVLGRIYSKVLQRIEASGYDVFRERISLSKGEKLRVTAQTWLTTVLPLGRR
jgi:phytoene synthase